MDGTGLLFAPFLEALGETVPVQVIQYPADVCAYSQVLNHIVLHVNSEEPHIVVAESFSSPAALSYAATNPSGLRAVVIVAGFSRSPLRPFVRTLFKPLLPLLSLIPLLCLIVRALLLNTAQEKAQWAKTIIASVPPETLRQRLESIVQVDVTAHVSAPMLYLRAQDDRLVMKKSVEIFQKRYPEVSVIEVSGSHLLLQSNPVASAKEVIHFQNLISERPNRW